MGTNKKHYPKVKVFVTKNLKFRASIQERQYGPKYEVTIGGESWKKGKAREHELIIKSKCERIVSNLNENIKHLFDE